MNDQTIEDILERFNDMNPNHAESLLRHMEGNPSLKDERWIDALIGVIAHADRDQETGQAGQFATRATKLLVDRFGEKAVKSLANALSEVAGVAIQYRQSAVEKDPLLDQVLNRGKELNP